MTAISGGKRELTEMASKPTTTMLPLPGVVGSCQNSGETVRSSTSCLVHERGGQGGLLGIWGWQQGVPFVKIKVHRNTCFILKAKIHT